MAFYDKLDYYLLVRELYAGYFSNSILRVRMNPFVWIW